MLVVIPLWSSAVIECLGKTGIGKDIKERMKYYGDRKDILDINLWMHLQELGTLLA